MAAGDRRQQSLHQKLLLARSLNTGLQGLAALQKKAEDKLAAEKRAVDKLSLSTLDSDQSSADALSHSISLIHSVKSLPITDNEKLSVLNHDTRLGSRYGSSFKSMKSMRSVRSYEDYHKSYNADDPRYLYQRKALEGIAMAFRTSRLYKALDKHEATTPQQIKDLVAAGDDAELVDGATGRGFVHKIVEMFEAPQEDEFLESQMMTPMICLVTAGANVNLRDTDGNTPLHLAFILNSGSKVVNMLVKLGADLTILNDSGQKVGDLINKNTDPHMVKALGAMVPGLWHAVESEDHDKVVNMLEKWSKIDISVDNVSLIDRAKEKGNQEIVKTLQEYWPTNQFIYAALIQDTKKMKKILKKEKITLDVKDISLIDEDGGTVEITLLGECLMMNLFDSAQFLLDKGAFINEPIQVGKDKEPVYFYLMKNNPSLVFSPMFMTLMERADLKLIKRFSVGVMYTGFTNSWPTEIVEKLIERGVDITARSEEGYTLRDNLLVQVAYYPRRKRLEKLQFVDQHVLRLAAEGNKDKLKDMVLNGYSSINIFDIKGRPCSYIAKKEGHRNVCDWIETVNETFKNINSLHEYIRQGNLSKAREYLTDDTAFIKDRAGRTSLHTAVLYQRKFVVRHLLKSYPGTVHTKDDNGRTPMHYACALPDAADIEEILSAAGADDVAQDDYNRCPMDYKLNDDEDFIDSEKRKTCAYNIYLLEVYLNFADGIIEDDFDLVRDTRDDLYEDVQMSDIIPKMYKSLADKPPGFLQLCLDNKRENIARYLINNGVDMWEDVVFEDQVMKFPNAVEKANMNRLNEFLSKKRRENTDEDARFKEAEEIIKRSSAWANTSSGSDTDSDVQKSKSCTIL